MFGWQRPLHVRANDKAPWAALVTSGGRLVTSGSGEVYAAELGVQGMRSGARIMAAFACTMASTVAASRSSRYSMAVGMVRTS